MDHESEINIYTYINLCLISKAYACIYYVISVTIFWLCYIDIYIFMLNKIFESESEFELNLKLSKL